MVHVYVDYSPSDSARIEAGVRAILTEPGAKKAILIPLTPLPNGIQYLAAAIRNSSDERCVNMVEYQLDMLPVTPKGMRAIETPDTVLAAFPHIRFTAGHRGRVNSKPLFWDILSELSELAYDTISLSNPPHMVVGGMGLGYDIYANSWYIRGAVDKRMYKTDMASRVEIALREVCGGVRTVLLVPNPEFDFHFMVILRNDTTINLVEVHVAPQRDLFELELEIIFQPQMALMFPGFQFTSVRLTDAEKQEVFQAPVLQYYQAMSDMHSLKHAM
jgi:hypothetical protein